MGALKRKKRRKNHNKGGISLAEALADRNSSVVHLTHNDLDAIGADAIHRIKYGEIFTIFTSVGKFHKNFNTVAGVKGKGDLLSITDLGYKDRIEDTCARARSNGWKIEWRDHHRWTPEEIERVQKKVDLLVVDTETCGCGIAARDLLPGDKQAAELAGVVCDYDLWKHEDPRSAIVGQVSCKFEYREYLRDNFVQGVIINEKIEEIYHQIKAEMDEQIRSSMKRTKILEGRYRIAFAPLYGYPSETAAAIRDNMDTDIEVIVSGNGRFSIRSKQPVSHLIAKQFGGGGHPNASGGTFPFGTLDRIIFRLLKRSRFYRKFVEVSETI